MDKKPPALTAKIAEGREAIGRDTLARTLIADSSSYSTKEDMAVEGERRDMEAIKEFDERLK